MTLIFAAVFGGLAVVFGAFGAHALKKKLTVEQLTSFETGVRYQMYHALVLLVIGAYFPVSTGIGQWTTWCFITGIFLFSFSIYGLCLTPLFGKKWKFLGPITPLGGLFLVVGWVLLLVMALR